MLAILFFFCLVFLLLPIWIWVNTIVAWKEAIHPIQLVLPFIDICLWTLLFYLLHR